MKLREVYEYLDGIAPFQEQEAWDNSGLEVGHLDQEIERVFLAVDATEDVLEAADAWGADLILTHHPLIFGGILAVNDQDFVGKRVLFLAEKQISYVAMHTNFDKYGMRDMIDEKLGFHEEAIDEKGERVPTSAEVLDPEGCMGSLAELEEKTDLQSYAAFVKDAFGLSHVKVFGDPKKRIQKVAVIGGSGKSEILPAIQAGADVLVTGDIDHHNGIDANTQGLSIIDAGHYGLEHVFTEYMERILSKKFPELTICQEENHEPFYIV